VGAAVVGLQAAVEAVAVGLGVIRRSGWYPVNRPCLWTDFFINVHDYKALQVSTIYGCIGRA